jgi:hypothetical protein
MEGSLSILDHFERHRVTDYEIINPIARRTHPPFRIEFAINHRPVEEQPEVVLTELFSV